MNNNLLLAVVMLVIVVVTTVKSVEKKANACAPLEWALKTAPKEHYSSNDPNQSYVKLKMRKIARERGISTQELFERRRIEEAAYFYQLPPILFERGVPARNGNDELTISEGLDTTDQDIKDEILPKVMAVLSWQRQLERCRADDKGKLFPVCGDIRIVIHGHASPDYSNEVCKENDSLCKSQKNYQLSQDRASYVKTHLRKLVVESWDKKNDPVSEKVGAWFDKLVVAVGHGADLSRWGPDNQAAAADDEHDENEVLRRAEVHLQSQCWSLIDSFYFTIHQGPGRQDAGGVKPQPAG
ncbi:hypothetical protein [Magnetospira sp. QH-2]|uniref:hypothetical protein n=1 Tax=Magnetospira sp. (strain QH-2) TaxID=1288970 RepID=UPI0003E811A2|nr:hypothetical protein [Magnetospira sp. QH-2]CCQ73209.1 Exported protein of unknown function [Magnetospira sp. QH-2]